MFLFNMIMMIVQLLTFIFDEVSIHIMMAGLLILQSLGVPEPID
jgi:hypothetical protein